METPSHHRAAPLPAGTQIGVYQLKRALVSSWFGHRYLAWNHHLGAHVLVEEYLPRALSARTDDGLHVVARSVEQEAYFQYGLERFLEESDMLIRVEHPHVIRTDSALHTNGTLYRVMEFIEGDDLAAAFGEKRSTGAKHDFYALALQLMEALRPVHEMGYVHGDLHPTSILLRKNGDAVLQGFSWAQLALAARMEILPEVLRSGYAAPEQYDCTNWALASVDLYGLGATLYRCIARRDPLSSAQRIAARQEGALDPQPMTALDPTFAGYSQALRRSIDLMLSLDRADRPQSVGDAYEAIKGLASGVPAADVQAGPGGKRHSDRRLPRSALWPLTGGLTAAGLASLALSLRTPEVTVPTSVTFGDVMQAAPGSPSGEIALQNKPAAAVSPHGTVPRANSPPTAASKNLPHRNSSTGPVRNAESNNAVSQSTPTDTANTTAPMASLQKSAITPTAIVSRSAQPTAAPITAYSSPPELDRKPSPLTPGPARDGASVADAARNDRAIADHLAAAKEHLAALRLTTPPGDNAYEHFQAVKALTHDHEKASEGLETIVRRYSWLIRKALLEGRLYRAQIYLKRARLVSPSAAVLEELSQSLDEAKARRSGRLDQ